MIGIVTKIFNNGGGLHPPTAEVSHDIYMERYVSPTDRNNIDWVVRSIRNIPREFGRLSDNIPLPENALVIAFGGSVENPDYCIKNPDHIYLALLTDLSFCDKWTAIKEFNRCLANEFNPSKNGYLYDCGQYGNTTWEDPLTGAEIVMLAAPSHVLNFHNGLPITLSIPGGMHDDSDSYLASFDDIGIDYSILWNSKNDPLWI